MFPEGLVVTRQQRHTMFWNRAKIWYDVDHKISLKYIHLKDYNDLMFLSWFHFSRFSTHSRLCKPRRPMPLKSVLGSFPWKPISHHCFEMRPERGESGRSSFHSWWVKRYLRKASLSETILLWPRGCATLWMVATYIYIY